MSDAANKLAHKIMALVDENPSELFSYERKNVEQQISDMLVFYSEEVDNERDTAYNLGYDEGLYEGRQESDDEHLTRIQELEEEINDLRRELEDANGNLDQAFTEGYETASRTENSIENFRFN
jgi:flagellar biosynthesis/type III secretory pathway protein FliH